MMDEQQFKKACELGEKSAAIWKRLCAGGMITAADKEVMRAAYWASSLPRSRDYNVYQWVEDGMPPL